MVSCAREKAAFAPQEVKGRGFKLEHNICLKTVLRPLLETVPHQLCNAEVEVLRLSVVMKPHADSECLWMVPFKAEAVMMKCSPRGKGGRHSGSSDSGCDSGSGGSNSRSPSDLESDVTDAESWASLASTADSSVASSDDRPLLAATVARRAAAAAVETVEPAAPAADEVDGSSTTSEGEGARGGSRLPRNTHTVWHNAYFFMTDNVTSPYLQMRVKITWLDPAHLGRIPTRKSLKPSDFGEQREQTILALKAWMINRWQANEFLKKRSRLEAWGAEVDSLRTAIAALGGRQRLHPGIRELIAQWAPTVLEAPSARSSG